MGNLEQVLLEEIPFTYDEEGECIYCQNIQIVENDNKNLIEQNSRILIKLFEKDKQIAELRDLLEELMNENQGYRATIDRQNDYISIAVRQFNNKNSN